MAVRGSRVVVVGSGPNGLVCAARLAQRGLDVTVLEAADRPGGAVATFAGRPPGFLHDFGAGFFPLAAASPAFRELELGIDWVEPPMPMAHPLADGRAICLHRDLDATVASLDAVAPGAGSGWRSVVGPLLRHGDLVTRTALARFPPLRAGAGLALGLGRAGPELARLMLGSAASLGGAALGDERATAWLAGSTVHSDLGPGAAGGGAFGTFLHFLGHRVGWPFPRGGAGRITDALVARIEAHGGEVRCGAPVARAICGRGRARGVETAGGERIAADAVVAAVSVKPFMGLLGPGVLPGRVERRLGRWRYGLGTFKVDFALEGPVPWTAPPAREAAVVHVGDTLSHQFRAVQEAGAGRVPAEPTLVVGQHSLHDDSRAPAGRHTLYVYTHVPQRPDVSDAEVADRIERRIETFAPGFGDLVLARALSSPATLERENASLVGGDLGGGSFELDQELVFRPDPALFRYRTPVRGLYLASASTHPGGGVHGVPGAGAADAVVADRRRPRLLA